MAETDVRTAVQDTACNHVSAQEAPDPEEESIPASGGAQECFRGLMGLRGEEALLEAHS